PARGPTGPPDDAVHRIIEDAIAWFGTAGMRSGPRLRWEGNGLRRIAPHGRESNVAFQTGRAVARKSDGQHQGLQVLLGHDRPPAKVKGPRVGPSMRSSVVRRFKP